MNIHQMYTQYRIMPSLQLHQRRVAGVAALICQHMSTPVDSKQIISACLLHDMGNIIKFNLCLFPQFLEPEGLDYWEKVKQDYITQYGNDEHEATRKITEEILRNSKCQIPNAKRIIELIDAILFRKAKENYEFTDFGRKIAAYADMRVAPHGVTSLHERLKDGRARFKLNKPDQHDDRVFFEQMAGYLDRIEKQIFEKCDIKPENITEDLVQQIIPTLSSRVIMQ